MTIVVALILIALAYAAYYFRDKWLPLVNSLHAKAVPSDNAQDIAHPSTPAQAAPQATAKPTTGSDNPFLDAYKQSNPQYADTSGSTNAAVDTSAPELDFAKVGNGVPIPLNGTKTIKGCPASVSVEFNQASGQSGATNTYSGAVNGVPFGPVSITATQKVQAQGPEVKVWVSCPGLQMEIRG